MKWVEALKVFNQGKPMWCVARKGTPEYDEVKRIMNSSKPEAVAKRNEERGEKVKEQLKEVADASSKRREEARKKYAEKIAEMEHHKKKEAEKVVKAPEPVSKEDESQYLHNDPFLTKLFGNSQSDWDYIRDAIKDVKEGKGDEIKNHDDFAFPTDENLNGKKVFLILPHMRKIRFKDVPPKSRKLVPGYDMRLIYHIDEDGHDTKSIVLVSNKHKEPEPESEPKPDEYEGIGKKKRTMMDTYLLDTYTKGIQDFKKDHPKFANSSVDDIFNTVSWRRWIKKIVEPKFDKLGEDIAEEEDKKLKKEMRKKFETTALYLRYY